MLCTLSVWERKVSHSDPCSAPEVKREEIVYQKPNTITSFPTQPSALYNSQQLLLYVKTKRIPLCSFDRQKI
jgi:hypothetical protein